MGLNIPGMALFRSMRPWRSPAGKWWAKPPCATPAAEFVAFLADVVATQPAGKQIHVIADNLSAHKTRAVTQFLALHPNVQLHYTPTYSSWLNQLEIWFSKIQRDLLTRGIFTSRADLACKIARYIKAHHKTAKPFKWTYRNTDRRIR